MHTTHSAFRWFFLSLTLCALLCCACSPTARGDVVYGDGVTLGTGLLGRDITDPNDQGLTYATWLYAASRQKAFSSTNEKPSNMFTNNTNKWYDTAAPSETDPSYIQLVFPSPFVLSHFTLQTGNDNASQSARNAKDWKIQGSNDGGATWNDIYVATDAHQALSTANNTTTLFTSFSSTDLASRSGVVANLKESGLATLASANKTFEAAYSVPEAYSAYRFLCTKTEGPQGVQLSEWELFGYRPDNSQSQYSVSTSGFGNATIHLDASNLATLSLDANGNVSRWGTTHNAVAFHQMVAANQPTLGTMTINGTNFNAVVFSSDTAAPRAGDFLTAPGESTLQTLFIVCDADACERFSGLFGKDYADEGVRMTTSTSWQASQANSLSNGGQMFYNGADTVLNINEPHLLTVVTSAAQTSAWALGSYSQHNRPFVGKVAEVLAFSNTLSNDELGLVYSYFASKYGLAIDMTQYDDLNLPTGFDRGPFYFGKLGEDSYALNTGSNGFGMRASWLRDDDPALRSAYDIFDETSGTTALKVLVGGSDPAADEQWAAYIDVLNPADATETGILTLAFDLMELDLLAYNFGEGGDLSLFYKATETGAFSRIQDGIIQNGVAYFEMPVTALRTGFYTVGIPEPATCVLLFLALPALLLVRRRRM